MTGFCIITKYHGPAGRKGARVSATTSDNRPGTNRPDRAWVGYNHGTPWAAHYEVARKLAQRIGAHGDWYAVGATAKGYIFARPGVNADPAFSVNSMG